MAKVLLISFDVVGQSMAGPGIRYWEFAKTLASRHKVVLMTPTVPDIQAQGFGFAPFDQMEEEIKAADVVICQRLNYKIALFMARFGPKLIIDAYDPEPLEHLEIFKHQSIGTRNAKNHRIVELFRFALMQADGILCANDLQRDLWLGF